MLLKYALQINVLDIMKITTGQVMLIKQIQVLKKYYVRVQVLQH